MPSKHNKSAFTPLRIMLILCVSLANLSGLIAYLFHQQSWGDALGVYSTVFILLFVFVIFLELVWLHNIRKNITDQTFKKSYSLAFNIYLILIIIGFAIVYLVLA